MNCIGVNYKKVPLEVREHYAFSAEEQREFHKKLREEAGCIGSVIVSTCNRSEIYFCGRESVAEGTLICPEGVTDDPNCTAETEDDLIAGVEHVLASYKGIREQEMLGQIYVYSGDTALQHLFHVACGLDSMVLGEDEILRQVKEGYLLAQKENAVCNEINIAFQGAMSSAKSIKTNTLLSKTPVSMGTLAANRIESFLQEMGGKKVLLVGITGQIGSILAKNLYSKGITDITGTSRHHSGFAGRFLDMEIRMVDFADRYDYVEEADVIVSATTGPHYTFLAQQVEAAAKTAKRRLFVDMAVPRDIDRAVMGISNCELVDIDDFKRAAACNNEIKLRETDKAKLILAEKLEETKKSIYMSVFMDRDAAVFAKWKDKSFGSVFYRLKDQISAEQLKALMEALRCIEE